MFTVQVVPEQTQRGYEITPLAASVRYASAAMGGDTDASFTVGGEHAARRQHWLPKNAKVRILCGGIVAWEGRIEDHAYDAVAQTSDVACFGYRRLLDDTSVKDIWSLRSIPWQPSVPVANLDQVNGTSISLTPATMFATVGTFDPSDRTRVGILVDNYSGVATAAGHSNWALYVAPAGVYVRRIRSKVSNAASSRVFAQASSDGATWTTVYDADPGTTPGEIEIDLTGTPAAQILLGSMATGTGNNGVWEDIRLLGTTVDEEATGGLYAHSVLADIIARIPGLELGKIDTGSGLAFPIPALARAVRDTAGSVIDEISSYFENEWAVHDNGTFDWMPASLDDPQWVTSLAGTPFTVFKVTETIAEIARKTYLLYEDAATGEPSEQSAESESQRNPFVKSGQTKDLIFSAPVPMTSITASRLAELVIAARGNFPLARGSAKLPASTIVSHLDGRELPAALIRAGDNMVVHDLPAGIVIGDGRDGESLFHIVQAETDMEKGETSFSFDSYGTDLDVTLARLTAATRVLTG